MPAESSSGIQQARVRHPAILRRASSIIIALLALAQICRCSLPEILLVTVKIAESFTSDSISASHNTFTANGGTALRIDGDSSGDLTENTFQDNKVRGVFVKGTLKGNVTHNIFTNNVYYHRRDYGEGGGALFANTFAGNLTHNSFTKNSSNDGQHHTGGGAFYINNFTGDIAHNTFTQNSMQRGHHETGGGAFKIRNFHG